ncbi:MAG: transposase [Candidatus Micrarchaeaceae archaeon]
MGNRRKTYSNGFKTKIVLEVLENNATINKLASGYKEAEHGLKDYIYFYSHKIP